MMGRLIRNPKIPAPRKFQNPTATKNMTAQRCEDVGDHDGGKQLQEVLHPKVYAPEPPEVRGREMGFGPGEQPDGVEGRDGQGGEKEQPGYVRRVLPAQPSAKAPKQHGHPEEESDGEQDLPEASQI